MNIIEFDSVMKYMLDMKTVYPVVENRITLLNLKAPDNPVPGSATHSILSVSIIFSAAIVHFFYINSL